MNPTLCPCPTDDRESGDSTAGNFGRSSAVPAGSRTALLSALMAAVMLAACGGGGSDGGGAAPAPAPSPTPSPAPSDACGTRAVLTTADLAPFAGSYAVRHFDSSTGSELGSGTLTLAGTTLTVTPGSGVSGSATPAEVTAVCANTNSSGDRIGVTAMLSGDRHMDFFAPAFNGLYVSGSDLSQSDGTARYVQATTGAGEPAPSPAPSGWGTTTVRSTALAADRVISPNLLPTLKWETSSFGAARHLSMARSANPLQGDAGQDIVGVRYVAATGVVLSASVALVPDPSQPVGTANYVATCGPCSGVTVDTTAGTVTFTDTPLTATLLSGSQQPATLSGSYRIPDWRPRAGTTVTAAGLAGCSIGANAIGATFGDIGCLAGTYVGTGIDGQACTVTIDSSAQTFRFDDGVKTNTFSFSSASGFTNLSTFRSAFVQSATLSRAIGSLESISLSAAPSAAVPEVTVVDLSNVQREGGTLNSVYNQACRIEFDRRTP
ncbi:MAG: hypothetical protein L6Q75_02620 [Burkholderiaceae bacterium]|nr:hypothetical protein [Burkholderiaceae bacterium]